MEIVEPIPLGVLPFEIVYSDPETLFSSLRSHARTNRYSVSKDSTKPSRRRYIYSRGSKYDSKGKDPKVHAIRCRKNTGIIKIDCLF
jgi:hypothetical protein